MKGGSNIISGMICLKQAYEHFESFRREFPGGKGDSLFKVYNSKISWVAKDMITHPFLSDQIRTGIKKEWESDVFVLPAISEKAALLSPEQRELAEIFIDHLLNGDEVKINGPEVEIL